MESRNLGSLEPRSRHRRRLFSVLPHSSVSEGAVLKGISTGDFSEPLAALLGPEAPGLLASTIVQLKAAAAHDERLWIADRLPAMVFKLAQNEKNWRKLNGATILEGVFRGVQFVAGLRRDAA